MHGAVFAAVLLAAAAASASAKRALFLPAPAAHERATARQPNGRLLRTPHHLQATTHDENVVDPVTHLEAVTDRMAGRVGPAPTDEELMQWFADGEAALADFMEGRTSKWKYRPPISDEDLKAALSEFYVLMLLKARVYNYALKDLADSGTLSQWMAEIGQLCNTCAPSLHPCAQRVHDDDQQQEIHLLRKRLDKAEAELASFRCEVNELKKRLQTSTSAGASEPPPTSTQMEGD
ncbi:unnamed protein product [Vitrella brassicaformis CCMP3155]|uniref:Uncharacterized protein n=1 Tax=Vitrella brassicaformis (strain CCMP3155) TaxID=1169540 RepID=A0A0G4GC16_VITBC|nr:unnamed protein product [Vitrella brassicaformis CCMP3155]|eukprot:CEM26507.1 unnamed protein product [Vitrella brassicaformis CCMP3155]